MQDVLAKLRLLAKVEAVLLRLHLWKAARQVSLVLTAALFGLLALAMLNVALYLYLAPRFDPALAALSVAGLDMLLAGAAVAAAVRLGLGSEAEAAAALRDQVSNELNVDAARLRTEFDDLVQDVKSIRSAVTGFMQPGGINLSTMFQWLTLLVGYLRRKRG